MPIQIGFVRRFVGGDAIADLTAEHVRLVVGRVVDPSGQSLRPNEMVCGERGRQCQLFGPRTLEKIQKLARDEGNDDHPPVSAIRTFDRLSQQASHHRRDRGGADLGCLDPQGTDRTGGYPADDGPG